MKRKRNAKKKKRKPQRRRNNNSKRKKKQLLLPLKLLPLRQKKQLPNKQMRQAAPEDIGQGAF